MSKGDSVFMYNPDKPENTLLAGASAEALQAVKQAQAEAQTSMAKIKSGVRFKDGIASEVATITGLLTIAYSKAGLLTDDAVRLAIVDVTSLDKGAKKVSGAGIQAQVSSDGSQDYMTRSR